MENIDVWADQVVIALKRELEDETKKYYKKELDRLGQDLYKSFLSKWDEYLHSYTPKQYVRTGRTRQGIKLDRKVALKHDGTLEVSVQFEDSYMRQYDFNKGGTKRNVFMAMNDGWGSFGAKPDRFAYSPPLHIIERVESEIGRALPDNIKLEIKWTGGKQ